MKLGVAFDFDGVLFDTYWFLPSLLAREALSAHHDPLLLEILDDVLEGMGVWDRGLIYRVLGLDDLYEKMWCARIAYARPTGVASLLWRLRGLGIRLFIVCGSDASVEDKLRRLRVYGVDMLVDDIVVYEPGGLEESLKRLVGDSALDMLVYVDDKPGNTCTAARVERVKPVLYRYRPPYPFSFAWRGPHCGRTASTPHELLDAILELLGARDPATPHHSSAQRGLVNAL